MFHEPLTGYQPGSSWSGPAEGHATLCASHPTFRGEILCFPGLKVPSNKVSPLELLGRPCPPLSRVRSRTPGVLDCLVSAWERHPRPSHIANTRTHDNLPWFRPREGISHKTLRPACLSLLMKMSSVGVQRGIRGEARRHSPSHESSLLLCYSTSQELRD
jgi:hypothetical protein